MHGPAALENVRRLSNGGVFVYLGSIDSVGRVVYD